MFLVGITGMSRHCAGLWRFLVVRARGRTAVELERERNRATAEVIRLLPSDCELLEYEPKGRLRVIRRYGTVTPPPASLRELRTGSNGELDP